MSRGAPYRRRRPFSTDRMVAPSSTIPSLPMTWNPLVSRSPACTDVAEHQRVGARAVDVFRPAAAAADREIEPGRALHRHLLAELERDLDRLVQAVGVADRRARPDLAARDARRDAYDEDLREGVDRLDFLCSNAVRGFPSSWRAARAAGIGSPPVTRDPVREIVAVSRSSSVIVGSGPDFAARRRRFLRRS